MARSLLVLLIFSGSMIVAAIVAFLAMNPERVDHIDMSDMIMGFVVFAGILVMLLMKGFAPKQDVIDDDADISALLTEKLSLGDRVAETQSVHQKRGDLQFSLRAPLNDLMVTAELFVEQASSEKALRAIESIMGTTYSAIHSLKDKLPAEDGVSVVDVEQLLLRMKKQLMKKDMSILLVDDDVISSQLAQRLFENAGCTHVQNVQSGAAALECLNAKPFDVIISDAQMPEMDGFALSQHIMELYANRYDLRPFVLMGLSGDFTTENRKRARQSGMRRLYSKPLTVDKILDMLSIEPQTVEQTTSENGLAIARSFEADEVPTVQEMVGDYEEALSQLKQAGLSKEQAGYAGIISKSVHSLMDVIQGDKSTKVA